LDERLQATLAETFIQTAQAKGLGAWGIYQHALRPSLPLFVSMAALQSGFLLGGTVMVEMIFVRRGLGTLLFQAVNEGDYPVVQGGVLLLALLYILTRHAGESLRQALDPR
jgi:peptide/nickel transport system permease protein